MTNSWHERQRTPNLIVALQSFYGLWTDVLSSLHYRPASPFGKLQLILVHSPLSVNISIHDCSRHRYPVRVLPYPPRGYLVLILQLDLIAVGRIFDRGVLGSETWGTLIGSFYLAVERFCVEA